MDSFKKKGGDMRFKRLLSILVGSLSLLLIPLIAMQFTNEVNWKFGDFVIAGFLLAGISLAIEVVFRKVKHPSKRIIILVLASIIFLLIWAEMALGIFNSPFAGS